MALQKWLDGSNQQPGAPGLRTRAVSLDQWRPVAQDVAAAGGRLLALWASADESGTPTIRAAFLAESNGLVLSAPILHPQTPYPGIGDVFPTFRGCSAPLPISRDCGPTTRTRARGCATPAGKKATGP